MRRRIAFFLSVLMAALVLCSCGGNVVVQNEVKRRSATGPSWTVLMYMCGSTLEEDYSRAGEVLSSLSYDLPENVNVAVETGGSRTWSLEDVYCEYLQRFEVQKNGLRMVDQTAAASMGESDTLYEFIEWGMETYPADNTIVVVWDHGGGPLGGVAYDSAYGFDSLDLEELQEAFSRLKAKPDMIGFDASLMSNLETASALSLYADYMVASEDIMPMSGWDYRGLFEYISENPTADMSEVGAVICDGVKNTASGQEADFVSMAVSDLSKATMLSLSFDGMADTMVNAADDVNNLRDLSYAMNELEFLGGNSMWEGYSNLIDIGELTAVVSEQIGSPASNIVSAINEMVIYRNMSEYHNTSSGLSVYYPKHRDSEELGEYRDICMSDSYMEYIEKTVIDVDIPDRLYSYEDSAAWQSYNDMAYENIMTAAADINGRYILNAVHPGIITRAGVNFYKYSSKDAGYIYLFRDYSAKYDASVGGYIYEFGGRLPELNSTPVAMYLVSQNTCFDIYSIPVIYEGKLTNIRVSKSKQAEDYGEYKILGLWNGVDEYSGMADRKYTELKTGDIIIPIYEVYGKSGDKSYVEGDKIRIGFGGAKITDKLIDDGDYIVSYTAEDMFGITYECDTNNLVSSKGTYKIMDY